MEAVEGALSHCSRLLGLAASGRLMGNSFARGGLLGRVQDVAGLIARLLKAQGPMGNARERTYLTKKWKQNSGRVQVAPAGHRRWSMAGLSAGAKLRAALAAARGAGEVRERVEARRGGGGDDGHRR